DISEFQLYEIKRKLRSDIDRNGFQVELDGILGSALDRPRVEMVMRTFAVQTVYHAAAYKHVPIVERNVTEGVQNNIFGTWRTAEAAMSTGVETFVLVSTDKAVRPTNVMGATKRFAELVLQGLAKLNSNTRFSMVRFGNVLDSSGSVVPLFREQIRAGGPVTVTHPDIIRYFMTIPEAAQLVLQAGSMGQGGDVFVLDMGEPVRIAELARRMIGLMGLDMADDAHPDGDIAIEYTGLRPGEKLYEELLIGDNVSGTQHPAIMRAEEVDLAWADLLEWLQRLEQAVERNDCWEIREILLLTVNGYVPADDIVDKVWTGIEPPLARSADREEHVDRLYRH
ncbi:MAG: polysaccharide biosynthesis protein, partial [Gammaproteobacteria bacterium]